MKYIFHLGRIPALSLAEIQAVFEKMKIDYTVDLIDSRFLILDIEDKIDFEELLPQVGGVIKIAKIIDNYKNLDDALEKTAFIIEDLNQKKSGKKIIGYSIYFTLNTDKNKVFEISENIKKKFIEIKKLCPKNSSIRIIFPDKNLEIKSVSVFKNKMIKKGGEFNFMFLNAPHPNPLPQGEGVILSKTIAVQDIESYSQRDYNRPKKDVKIGMMPPKLAQIMINLAQVRKGATILDPFCGIGTILQEALLNDYRVVGSDANGEQIVSSKENLKWLETKYVLEYPDYKIFQADTKSITKKIKQNSIDAIVTESTLGPVYKKVPSKIEIRHNYNLFIKMYTSFFQIAKSILRKKGRLVITIPAYKMKDGKFITAPFIDRLEKIGYSIVSPLSKEFLTEDIEITDRNSIIYYRQNQIVAREVFVFENK
ncbi:MAG: methyltransferase domain-containing protein [Candidatus Pacebacteria bacterium]|nr:methyltransferase domain-containing protein [Candidatus Paceibacterota bacterium]